MAVKTQKPLTKKEKQATYEKLAKRIQKHFNISDEFKPTIEVKGCPYNGLYCEWEWVERVVEKKRQFVKIDHYIIIRPSQGLETFAHEMAHWLQMIKIGATACWSRTNSTSTGQFLAWEHDKLTARIYEMISDCKTIGKYSA